MESSICEAFANKQHRVSVFFFIWRKYITQLGDKAAYLVSTSCVSVADSMFLFGSFFWLVITCTGWGRSVLSSFTWRWCDTRKCTYCYTVRCVLSVLPDGVHGCLYVDDLSIYFFDGQMPLIERNLQLAIIKVSQWAKILDFPFSALKTVVMHFCRLRGAHTCTYIMEESRVWRRLVFWV